MEVIRDIISSALAYLGLGLDHTLTGWQGDSGRMESPGDGPDTPL